MSPCPFLEYFSLAPGLHPLCPHRAPGRFSSLAAKLHNPVKRPAQRATSALQIWRKVHVVFSVDTAARDDANRYNFDLVEGRNPDGFALFKKTEVQWGFFPFLGGENPPGKQKSSGGNPHYRLGGKTPPLSIFRYIGPHVRRRQRTGTLSNEARSGTGAPPSPSALSITVAKLEPVVPTYPPQYLATPD
jgi:hypothetical protein